MRSLVVDDELVSRKKMENIMFMFGDCISVDSGKSAVQAFETSIMKGEPFDVIMLDVSMPNMDGTEVLYEIRSIEQKSNIPKMNQSKIIMVTAQSDKDTVITCIQAGCNGYIVKPFNRTVIAQKLKELKIIDS